MFIAFLVGHGTFVLLVRSVAFSHSVPPTPKTNVKCNVCFILSALADFLAMRELPLAMARSPLAQFFRSPGFFFFSSLL